MPKKLIEVALPLEAINKAAAREKSIRHGHPSTLHLWWARRPLAAARAVLFAQLVDDPSTWPTLQGDEPAQQRERARLFDLIERMVPWEASHDEAVLREVRREVARSHARFRSGTPKADAVLADDVPAATVNEYLATELPPVHDPFAGGGTIPLEAQRLGLRAIASDLNPVAVLINKALIEIPPKFAGQPPVHPGANTVKRDWRGAEGLAEDVRFYGKWMRDEAFKRIGHLYPKVALPKEKGGGEATVIAWLWARTVKCSNPRCGATMPLARSFVLSTKKGKEHWVEPVVERESRTVRFEVREGVGGERAKGTVDRRGARCVVCGEGVALEHVREEGRAGRMGAQMMAIVAEGKKSRVYLSPTAEHEAVARSAKPTWVPEQKLPEQALGFRVQNYGMTTWGSLFTARQLTALGALSDSVLGIKTSHAELIDDTLRAICTYLSFGISKSIDSSTTLCGWQSNMDRLRGTFARQALAMSWDFAETNPFAGAAGDVYGTCHAVAEVLDKMQCGQEGVALQQTATRPMRDGLVYSTDPPYYDNVPYADLSDFFYVWLRRSLEGFYGDLFGTLLVPKSEELIADPFRRGSVDSARSFFEDGLLDVFGGMRQNALGDVPAAIYYAFKQSEAEVDDESPAREIASTGWETMLSGLVEAGWVIGGTWPITTELGNRVRNIDSNALASSIVLVCRKRLDTAPSATRQDFLRTLKRSLPRDLKLLQQGNIAPVDFAQAAIGPGMAVFSSYARVLESDGAAMTVRTALQLINQVLDEVLSEQEGDFDADTRCALGWFQQHQYGEGEFGSADVLARAKGTSVQGLVEAGVMLASRGKVRLLKRDELDAGWNPATDARCTVWEVTQHLIRALETGGETAAASLVARVGSRADAARDLAYRLYSECERRKWAQEAMGYNALVTAWPELTRLAGSMPVPAAEGPAQRGLAGIG
jgi:putative DNA methylase